MTMIVAFLSAKGVPMRRLSRLTPKVLGDKGLDQGMERENGRWPTNI
ncbi:MAG: hypothetical protein GX465_05105 [Acidobacteria bacterium]|nr:hypothetical protein [Acidobacteriota bacterium]